MNEWNHCVNWFQDKCNDYSNCKSCKKFIPTHKENCHFCDNLKAEIITLCGSTKFKDKYNEVNKFLTLKGNIVISVSCFGHADKLELSKDNKHILDAVHLKKIDISDSIYVIDVDGYIGDSTRREIEYAKDNGKNIYYYSKEWIGTNERTN